VDAEVIQALHDALAEDFPDQAELISDDLTVVREVPTSFLGHYSLYRVEHMSLHRPILFYVGYSPDRPVHVLSSDAQDFVALARDDGVDIATADQAVDYVRLLVETTRSMSRLTYLVDSVDGLQFRPNLDPAEQERRQAVLTELSDQVGPPQAKARGDDWEVTAWIVVEQALERHDFLVRRDGTIERSVKTVAEDIPLVYGA
jgi:hypothetical protein